MLQKDSRGKLRPYPNDLQKNKLRILGLSIIVGIGFAILGLILGVVITVTLLYILYILWGGSQCTEICGSIFVWFSTVMGLMMASLMGVDFGRRTDKRLSEQN